MTEPRMIRGWMHPDHWDGNGKTVTVFRPEYSRADAVVIVPASYMDAVQELVETLSETHITDGECWVCNDTLAALQRYREATQP